MASVTGDFDKIAELANKCEKLTRVKAELSRDLAEEYTGYMQECFRASHGPYGEAWEPVKFRVSANGPAQKPLLDTGIMKNAIHPVESSINEDGFHVVVPQAYATTHQYGAVIKPKNAKVLCFPGPVTYTRKSYVSKKTGKEYSKTTRKGSGMIFAMKVTIPARPFAMDKGIPPELSARFDEAANEFLEDYFDQ